MATSHECGRGCPGTSRRSATGNPAWQAAYRNAVHQRFGFSPASFAKGTVIQALELANMWMNDTDRHLAAIQASIITGVLTKAPDR